MNDTGIGLVSRFLKKTDTSEALRTWTIIRLLCTPGDVLQWRKSKQGLGEDVMDDGLVEEILGMASVEELAKVLTLPIARKFQIATFEKFFRKVCDSDIDSQVLSNIGFAADMFLDNHRGVFLFPMDLLKRLLSSDDLEMKLRGIMLLNHSDCPPQDSIEEILSGIEFGSPEGHNKYDLCCLTAFREFVQQHNLADLDDDVVQRARRALLLCISRQDDEGDKAIVRTCISSLPGIGSEGETGGASAAKRSARGGGEQRENP